MVGASPPDNKAMVLEKDLFLTSLPHLKIVKGIILVLGRIRKQV